MNRTATINWLVANCSCWKGQGDREVLNGLPDEKLAQLKAQAEENGKAVAVANAAVRGLKTRGGQEFRINPETGEWETRASKRPTANMPANGHPRAGGVEEEEEPAAPAARTPAPPPRKKAPPPPAEEPVPEDEEEYAANRRRSRPKTEREWLAAAPPEVQRKYQGLARIEQQQKDQAVRQLLANVSASDYNAQYQRLMQRPLDELQNDVALMPPKAADADDPTANRNGAARGPAKKRPPQTAYDDDVLQPPSINWQSVRNGGRAEGKDDEAGELPDRTPTTANAAEEWSEDDWYRHAPESVRNAFTEAAALSEREKRKLIAQLTDNLDDEQERRLTAKLGRMSLDDLRDLAALAPTDNRQANYFGASAAPMGVTPAAAAGGYDPNEDVLLPPTFNWQDSAGK